MDLRDQARILDIKEGLDQGKFKLFCQVDDSGKNSSYVIVDPTIETKGKVLLALDLVYGILKPTFLDGAEDLELRENKYFQQSLEFANANKLKDQLLDRNGEGYFYDPSMAKLPSFYDPEKYSSAGSMVFNIEGDVHNHSVILVQRLEDGKIKASKENGDSAHGELMLFLEISGFHVPENLFFHQS